MSKTLKEILDDSRYFEFLKYAQVNHDDSENEIYLHGYYQGFLWALEGNLKNNCDYDSLFDCLRGEIDELFKQRKYFSEKNKDPDKSFDYTRFVKLILKLKKAIEYDHPSVYQRESQAESEEALPS